MVYDKKRSGDPDYDDKQPIEAHAGGTIVKSADGREVLMSDVLGPVDRVTGEGVNMDVPTDELDNRPAPGEVAKAPSDVQTYNVEDTPAADRTDDADAIQPEPAKAAPDSKATTPRKSTTAK